MNEGTCVEAGCSRLAHARGFCKAHYSAWYRLANPSKVARYNGARCQPTREAVCPCCGVVFEARQRQIYCTDHCQRVASKRREHERSRQPTPCSWCDVVFDALPNRREGEHRYCTPVCQAEGKAWRKRKVFSCPIPWADCKTCGVRFISKKNKRHCPSCWCPVTRKPKSMVWFCCYCAECSEPFLTRRRGEIKFCSRQCKMKSGRREHQLRKRSGFVERVFRRKVYQRDKWCCRICGEFVDRDAQVPDPLAPTLDHIVPVALGGEHSYANVQCAHFICNSRKGADLEGQLHFAA